jgi:hypothetical protein
VKDLKIRRSGWNPVDVTWLRLEPRNLRSFVVLRQPQDDKSFEGTICHPEPPQDGEGSQATQAALNPIGSGWNRASYAAALNPIGSGWNRAT